MCSDHSAVRSDLNVSRPKLSKHVIRTRKLRNIDLDAMRHDIDASQLCTESDGTHDLSSLVAKYNSVLRELLDKHAPESERKISLRPHAPWYDDSLRASKREKRRLERKWVKSGLAIDREIFHTHCEEYRSALETAKVEHYNNKLSNSNQRQLFRTVDRLSNAKSSKTLPSHDSLDILTSTFQNFFESKVEKIRTQLVNTDPGYMSVDISDSCQSEFTHFHAVTIDEVRKIIMQSSKTSCSLDPLPTWLLANVLDSLLPTITTIINESFSQCVIPSKLKVALVTPLIKKPTLDPDLLKNYRPISNLPFLHKILERAAVLQLQQYLSENKLHAKAQSAYRQFHSTETALIRVTNDIFRAVDQHQEVVLVLLDLSAAFDTIDHQALLRRMESRFGIKGPALDWLQSYFRDRHQRILIDNVQSNPTTVTRGAPQGSVLGPLAFTMYSSPLEEIVKAHNLQCVIYADDTQVYVNFKPSESANILPVIELCVKDIKSWMTRNMLMLKDSKTEILHLHSRHVPYSPISSLQIGNSDVDLTSSAKNLGVVLDNSMSMSQHVSSICKSASFALYKNW